MDKREIYNHFAEIFKQILQDEDKKEWIEYPASSETFVFSPTITICSGVTRCAVIDKNFDWIVKFDMAEEGYCEREVELYDAAESYGCADCLAPVMYVGRYYAENGYYWDLYGYKKACCGYHIHSYDNESVKCFAGSPLTERNGCIAADLIENYGIEMFRCLNRFCEDNDVNDIHCGNVGYIAGKLVLIDYAGYHDGSEEDM